MARIGFFRAKPNIHQMQNQRGDFSRHHRILPLSAIAILIGCAAALIAQALLLLICLFTNIFYYAEFSFASRPPSMEHWGPAFVFVPVMGGLLIGLMARFGSEKIRGHGIPEALEAILFGKSIMQPKVAVLKPLSSAISIGSGGPFGAEGPIIMTGGAFGSILAQFFHLTSVERKVLLVSGAAAGMSAVFATPIAAVLLSVELLLFEWKPRSLIPVAIASACAAAARVHLLGAGPVFPVMEHASLTDYQLAAAALLGILAGALATGISFALYKIEDGFLKLPIHWMWWPALGGVVIGLGGFIQPRALGVGYDVISDLLTGNIALQAILALVAVKLVIWIFALASGTSGGVLAPLLIFGCSLGAVLAPALPGHLPSGVWAAIGMGAIMAGMMRSPFTAIFFCLELTNDTALLLPLLIASSAAYAFTVWSMKRSILTEKIARRGFDIFREYSVDPLERFTVREVMKAMEDPNLDRESLSQAPKIYADESCREAAEKMAAADIAHLQVLSPESREPVGWVTLADLLKARRFHLEEESKRATLFPVARAR